MISGPDLSNPVSPPAVGVVVIGRNEGERLRRCLASVEGQARATVYVDSGSSDGSVALAQSMGVSVVHLDLATPFTAARARNAGFAQLCTLAPDIEYIQFVDGDCEIIDGWLATAVNTLNARPEITVLAGRLNERFPEHSIYNRLGDLEWNKAGVGEVSAVGGLFMIRRATFEQLGGFNPSVAAGEEPELWARLRAQGGRLWRLDQAMAWHDLAMTRFGQWWRRQTRNGYGGLDVTRRFGMTHFRRDILRARFWAAWPFLTLLAGALGCALASPSAGIGAMAVVFALWPGQWLRIALRTRRQGQPWSIALPFALFSMLAFWPQAQGQLRYLLDQFGKRRTRLIEYKQTGTG